jgi:hypothetical protein
LSAIVTVLLLLRWRYPDPEIDHTAPSGEKIVVLAS